MRLLRELADALAHAHEHGVVHRDVKPENILLESGHAVLADFGVARALEQATLGERLRGTGLGSARPTTWRPSSSRVSPAWMPADLYALGVVAYEMLAGAPPLSAATAQRVVTARRSTARAPCPAALDTAGQSAAYVRPPSREPNRYSDRPLAPLSDLRPRRGALRPPALPLPAPQGAPLRSGAFRDLGTRRRLP